MKSFAVNLNPTYSIMLNTTTQTTTGQYFLATITGERPPELLKFAGCCCYWEASMHASRGQTGLSIAQTMAALPLATCFAPCEMSTVAILYITWCMVCPTYLAPGE